MAEKELDGEKKEQQQEIAEEEEEKPEAPPEAILEQQQQRDPDEMVFAEQAIHSYATQVLAQFRETMEGGLATFEAWMLSQNAGKDFNDRAFMEDIGQVYLDMMMGMMGGKDSPIAQSFYAECENQVDVAARQQVDASLFVNDLSRATRDFTWYLRDNLQTVLSNQWDEIRDLAYEGSTDFIPLLHAYGMPQGTLSPSEINGPLLEEGARWQEAIPKQKEEVVEQPQQLAKVEEEEAKMEEDPNALAFEEEEKQKATI
jgi:hypothetical protein